MPGWLPKVLGEQHTWALKLKPDIVDYALQNLKLKLTEVKVATFDELTEFAKHRFALSGKFNVSLIWQYHYQQQVG